jgi:hypothetical protein
MEQTKANDRGFIPYFFLTYDQMENAANVFVRAVRGASGSDPEIAVRMPIVLGAHP